MKISIVIPIYNGVCYISSCLLSLRKQTYTDWEAVCVNDGSRDGSMQILLKHAKEDCRIRVISQENQGVVKARSVGIEQAQGEYVCFLDVDDTLQPDALKLMVREFDENPKADIVVSGFNLVVKGKIKKRFCPNFSLLGSLDYMKRVLGGKNGWELCAKLYRRKLFDEPLKLPLGMRVGEDASVFIQLVCRAKFVAGCHVPLYNYIQHSESVSHRKSVQLAEETLRAGFFIEEYLRTTSCYEEIKNEIDTMFLLFYSNSSRKGYLGKENPFVQKIKQRHWHFKAFFQMPLYKALYIFLYFHFGRLISRVI